ncbi:MAG: imidazole glycerol phosphate synthase subunit HisH [Bacteroidales bacterium]|nr:imidazole glycerol phosphate synthase subunit HisH [Bacteroidales bacterium]
MIAIIDYNAGNLCSVENALRRLGAQFEVTSDPERIAAASHVLMPGVGEASSAMENLRERGLVEVVKDLKQPVLGICIGLQLMCTFSEEGRTPCLGVFDTAVRRFDPSSGAKIPHMGWNTITGLKGPLFKGVQDGSFVYYVHSFRPEITEEQTIAVTEYAGSPFSGALCRDNFFGTQFHPEKSGPVGARILKNFIEL